MAKSKTHYVCDSCGESHSKWSGKCNNCGEWNTLKEFRESKLSSSSTQKRAKELEAANIKDAAAAETTGKQRLISQITPLDEVLGGGLVVGSVGLIAGEPGIGKSTLLMQLVTALGANHDVLYVSGEESNHQVGMRAKRLQEAGGGELPEKLKIASTTNTDDIVATIMSRNYKVVVVDSIQTIASDNVDSNPGNTAQITQSTQMLIRAAKSSNTSVVIVGHVTKEGNIAGPKTLEHLVDVVLNLEGDRYGGFKILRAVKNRFGSTNEIGLFEMNEAGLEAIENPSAAMLEQRQRSDGSVVLATIEGSRPLLVEVQALVNRTNYGYPKRTASGIDLNRLNLLIAVLNRRTKLDLSEHDIFINIVGGIKLQEPAADLAICMAIASAAKSVQLAKDSVVFGEVGLSGEIRHVPLIAKRIAEAKKLGFKEVIGPKQENDSKSYRPVSTLREALILALEG